MKAVEWTPEERERRRQTAHAKQLHQHMLAGRARMTGEQSFWTAAELALLGVVPDEEIAARTNRTHNALRIKREKLGIANPTDRRKQR